MWWNVFAFQTTSHCREPAFQASSARLDLRTKRKTTLRALDQTWSDLIENILKTVRLCKSRSKRHVSWTQLHPLSNDLMQNGCNCLWKIFKKIECSVNFVNLILHLANFGATADSICVSAVWAILWLDWLLESSAAPKWWWNNSQKNILDHSISLRMLQSIFGILQLAAPTL